jgi:hypothetical protein
MERSPQLSLPNGGCSGTSLDIQDHQNGAAGPIRSQQRAVNQNESRVPWRKQFARARNKLVDRRTRISRRRIGLQEKRHNLRRLRRQASKLDASFISALRKAWAAIGGSETESLFEQYEKVQEIRDAIGPEEDDYDQEEDEAAAAEYQLEEAERELYDNYLKAPFDDDALTLSPPASPGYSSDGDDADVPDMSDPVVQYESRIGDANILHERLGDLMFERAQYLEEKQRRDPLGLPLYEPNLTFLHDFDRIYGEVAAELQQAEEDIRKLKQIALEKGLLSRPESGRDSPTELNAPKLSKEPAAPHSDQQLVPDHASTTTRQSVSITGALFLIHTWLTGINFPVEKVLRTAKMSFSVRDTEGLTRLVRKYCATYFTRLGSWGDQSLIQSSEQTSTDSVVSNHAQPLQEDDWEDLKPEAVELFRTASDGRDLAPASPNMNFKNYWEPDVHTPTTAEEAGMRVSLQNAELRKDREPTMDIDSQSV